MSARITFVVCLAGVSSAPQLTSDARADAQPSVLPAVRELAESTTVNIASAEPARTAKLCEAPLLVYGDQTREISASSLWVWMDGHSPVLLQKIEKYDHQPRRPTWVNCYSSLSEQPVDVSWAARPPVQATGIEYLRLSNKATAAARLDRLSLHWRSIIRGISIYSDDGTRRELRLMPKPLLEFADENRGVIGGAVFAFAYGTNPDVCVIVRAVRDGEQATNWELAPVKMTSAGIVVTDETGREIWSEPDQAQAGDYGHWGFFAILRIPTD